MTNSFPTATELEALANSLFPAYNTAEAETCAQGIEALVTRGDTAVLSRAAARAEQELSRFSLSGANAQEADYARALKELSSAAEASGVFPGSGYAALSGAGTQDAAAASSAPSWQAAITAPIAAFGSEQALSAADAAVQSAYSAPAGGYSPTVVSQQQADAAPRIGGAGTASQAAPSEPSQAENANSRIIIGTKTLAEIRADFPILSETVNGHPLIWLDNGATTQRPRQVIDRLSYYYEHENSNVHRGVHELADRSTNAYEGARQTVADFIGAPSKDNIVFVRGTTEAINLVAQAYVKPLLQPGDEIIVSLLEHHANIVPWQLIAEETGAVIKVIPIDQSGQLVLSEYEKLFTPRTKFVSVTHVSNTLGTITPAAEIVAMAHAHGVRTLIDGAQSIAHIPVNVAALDTDFFVFSGHKVFAPTGIGVVYGKSDALAQARPYQGGGNMIKDVTFERTIYNEAPNKFEAGTGSIADAVGLGAALDYLSSIGMAEISRYEHELTVYAMKELEAIPGLHLYGHALERSGVLSFTLDGHSNEEVGAKLNTFGIAVRAGHHCAQPVLRSLGLEGTVRPVLAFYNSPAEIDALARSIRSI